MISMYSGTIGSGKSYHALEDICTALDKGKYVIANFPLTFSAGQIRRGWADRFMYVDDSYFMGIQGIQFLLQTSAEMGWDVDEREGLCLCVIDEATNYFPKEDATKPEQRLWRTYFTQSRKQGYDFILIVQDENSLNKTISKCIEYDVKHRKANNIFPFKLLNLINVTLFFHVTYWKQQRTKLKTGSTIFVKRLAAMYKSKRMFANLDEQIAKELQQFQNLKDTVAKPVFGNCRPDPDDGKADAGGRVPEGEGPEGVGEAVSNGPAA